MRRSWLVAILIACKHPAPPPPPPIAHEVDAGVERARTDFKVGESPTSLVVVSGALVWTDSAGAIWTMPAAGGEPRQLSDQKRPDFAFHVFAAGDAVFATSRNDVLRVALPDGTVTKLGLALAEYPEASVADAEFMYLTLFKRDDIVRVPVGGGAPKTIAKLPRAVLALHGGKLYAASYATGALVEIPSDGRGPLRPIVKRVSRPTALAADATHAFVYSEDQRVLLRVGLVSGDVTEIAHGLVNSDALVLDGEHLYTRSWGTPHAVLRVPKDGSREPEVLADDLATPSRIAVDGDAIYVTSRDDARIVRFAKSALR
jgi:hypothetical protein